MSIFKRRRFLVNAFQYKLLAYTIVYQLGILAIVYGVAVAALVIDLRNRDLSIRERGESAQVLLHIHEHVLPVLVPLLIVLTLHLVFVTHRIAGPIYRFAAVMRSIARGNLSMTVRLRGGDYLKPEALIMNDMIESLNARVHAAQDACKEARDEAAALESGLEEGRVDAAEHITLVREHLSELAQVLDAFETKQVIRVVHTGSLDSTDHAGERKPHAA